MDPSLRSPKASTVIHPTIDEVFEEIQVKFLSTMPEEELQVPARLFNELEQAWWFYEDFYADHFSHL